jgi:hypothetical protein
VREGRLAVAWALPGVVPARDGGSDKQWEPGEGERRKVGMEKGGDVRLYWATIVLL